MQEFWKEFLGDLLKKRAETYDGTFGGFGEKNFWRNSRKNTTFEGISWETLEGIARETPEEIQGVSVCMYPDKLLKSFQKTP